MRYDADSRVAMFHRVGILEKGTAMSEPKSYIVEIDEQGNPSIKYADGTPYAVNIPEYSAEVLRQLVPRNMEYTVTEQIDGLYIGAVKGSEKFLLPYSPQELMETVEGTEGLEYYLDEVAANLVRNTGSSSFYEMVTGKIVSVDDEENVTVKGEFTEFTSSYSVSAVATFEDGESCVNCSVMVNVGNLEYGPYMFLFEKNSGGDTDAGQNEDVGLPEAV